MDGGGSDKGLQKSAERTANMDAGGSEASEEGGLGPLENRGQRKSATNESVKRK